MSKKSIEFGLIQHIITMELRSLQDKSYNNVSISASKTSRQILRNDRPYLLIICNITSILKIIHKVIIAQFILQTKK